MKKLTGSDIVFTGSFFGFHVAVSNDYAVIGAVNVEAAYIFKRTSIGWVEEAKLTASDAGRGYAFGRSVSVFGNHAIVGAQGANEKGAAYLFNLDQGGWKEQAKLTASSGVRGGLFGSSAMLDNNTAIVGEWKNNAAYVYEGLAATVGVQERLTELPKTFELRQNYPNPFNPSTKLSFSLATVQRVTLKVFDLTGKEVATLLQNEQKTAGTHELTFDARNLPSGVYLYKLQAGQYAETKKMILLR